MVIEPGNNVNSSGTAAGKARQNGVRTEDGAQTSSSANASSADNVSLSHTGQSLSRLQAAVANTSEVDADKVANAKAAIASGTYQIDAQAIAGKMLSQEEL